MLTRLFRRQSETPEIMPDAAAEDAFYARLAAQTARQRQSRRAAGAAIDANLRAWQTPEPQHGAGIYTLRTHDGMHGIGQ